MSMKYRRLDAKGDYTFGSGTKNYLTDLEAVAQAIKTRLFLLFSEWWEDREDGLPLFEEILGTSGASDNLEAVDIIVSERIANTKDVVSIVEFSSSFKERKYYYECKVDTVYGMLYITNKEG